MIALARIKDLTPKSFGITRGSRSIFGPTGWFWPHSGANVIQRQYKRTKTAYKD
jgi:hypothetical protein